MKHLVEAGTDAATLLLFDPGALPEDFDERIRGGPAEMLDELTRSGKAYWINTGADGAYLLHAYVDEPVPAALQPYVREPITVDNFSVPTGRLFFTGAECGFRENDRFLRKHPHMGGSFVVRPGTYRLTLYRTEYPDGLTEQLFREQVSLVAYRLHQNMGCFVGVAVLSLLGLGWAWWLVSRWLWFAGVLPTLGVLVLLPVIVSRLRPYRQARERFRGIEREFPSIIACLEPCGP